LGLGLGLALAFGLELLRRGIKTEAEAERAFGYPVLGVIPIGQPARSPRHLEAGWLAHRLTEAPFSEIGEAVRHIRFRVSSSFVNPGPKVVLVTSALPGEGKSATTLLLAASYATAGHRTVVIDCDLRRHELSRMVTGEQVGVADFLTGAIGIDEAIVRLPLAEIDLITAGRASSEAADALTVERMNELLVQLRERYDIIIIDASPLLTVVDGLVMATIADRIIVVAEWSRTPREAIAEGLKALGGDVHRVAGVVLNKVDLTELRAYGYGYHGYTLPSAGDAAS
jgi:succinoglycan biosynthesis transport protein ExoP